MPSSLIRFLLDNLYVDSYRFCHASRREFSWSNNRALNEIKTRIDHVWISDNWINEILYAEIINADGITESDHKIVTCMIYTKDTIRNYRISQRKRFDQPRNVYDYHVATKRNWDNY